MAILTIEQLRTYYDPDRIQQLATDSSLQFGTRVYKAEIVQGAIDQAEGAVKNSLSLQYTTAQLEADAGIRRMTSDIAMYYLEARRPPVSAETIRLHKFALTLLNQLQEGKALLSAVSQLLPDGPSAVPTEAISTGFFNLTTAEQDSLT